MLQRSFLSSCFIFLLPFTAVKESRAYFEHIHIVTEHLPPFQILEKNKEVSGYATEIVRGVLEQTPFKYSITIYPWTRAYNMTLNKANTCIYSIARTADREHLFHWIKPIAQINSAFIGLKTSFHINVQSIEDAKKYKVAVLRDDISHQILLSHGFEENKNLFIINNTFSLLKLLRTRNNIDLILADDLTVKYRAKFNGIDPNLFTSYFQLNKEPVVFHLACNSKTSDEVINQLSDSFNAFEQSDEFKNIELKWKSTVH